MDETQIIAAAQGGDAEAWQALHGLYHRRLWGLMWRITQNKMDADDQAQEAWVQAYLLLPRYEHRERFWGWLSTIAHFTCSNHRQAQHRRVQCVYGVDADCLIDDPADTIVRRAFVQSLIRHITDPIGRETVRLRYYSDQRWADIAARLGVPVSTLQLRCDQAIAELQVYLGLLAPPEPKVRRKLILSIETQKEATRRYLSGEFRAPELAALYGVSVPTMKRYIQTQRRAP
jgi:RNA polymerase sigma factor (sigma-70 family)